MLNRRSHPRKRSQAPATLASGSTETAATILDISASGARIKVRSNVFLSQECFLNSPNFLGAMPSKVVWRRQSEIGLMFRSALLERAAPQRPAWTPTKPVKR